MKTYEGFNSITIEVKDGTITLRQQGSGYSYTSISLPVSHWGSFVSAVSSEILNPTNEAEE